MQELVPRATYNKFGAKSTWFIDPDIVEFLKFIRKRFDMPIYINNWHWGGAMQYRGYRPPWCKVGASKSQHKSKDAVDFNMRGVTPDEIRADILNNKFDYLPYITTIEHGDFAKTWVHVDKRWTNTNEILIVKP